jgi:hypothetical protein
MKSFMCQWGDCREEGDLEVMLSWKRSKGDTERHRFCCLEHAGLWCKERADKLASRLGRSAI